MNIIRGYTIQDSNDFFKIRATCFLLLFRQLIRSLVDEGFQIVRVFLHHGHHVVKYVWLPGEKIHLVSFYPGFIFRFILLSIWIVLQAESTFHEFHLF